MAGRGSLQRDALWWLCARMCRCGTPTVEGRSSGLLGTPVEGRRDRSGAQGTCRPQVVTAEALVAVRAAVRTVDFEGRSDGRSVRTLLAQVAPRHLVLVSGSPEVRPRCPNPSRTLFCPTFHMHISSHTFAHSLAVCQMAVRMPATETLQPHRAA